jgi:NADH pyrophosphatase NudC (nudix superfamily)
MDNSIEVQIKLEMQETVDEFIYKAIEPFAETIIGKVSKEELKQILIRGTQEGRWIKDRYCSNCGWSNEDVWFTASWTGRYCPNCGAKMEVDE